MTETSQISLTPDSHIHLVGIGGFGLSAIARVLLDRGYTVSGSDMLMGDITAELEAAGTKIYQGHAPEHIDNANLVLVSSAIAPDNVEVKAAIRRDIPVVKRSDLIGMLMQGFTGIAVAGTHGKTTTTGMIAQILAKAELDPTIIIGGILPFLGSNGVAGRGEYFLIEADEYDYMFLGLTPHISVITNIDYDHPDLFPTIEAYREAFRAFVENHGPGSILIAGADDEVTSDIVRDAVSEGVQVVTYGIDRGDWLAVEIRPNHLGGSDFIIHRDGLMFGLARLRVPGTHNVQNALAAAVLANSLGIDFAIIREALAGFGGVDRRFQIIGEIGTVTIIDDYGHHPKEISATLAATRQRFPGRRIWAVWQPHTYSRLKFLGNDFSASFSDASQVVVLPIFGSREVDDLGQHSEAIVGSLDHQAAIYKPSFQAAADYILERIMPGDVLITLTAGDGNIVGQIVLEQLRGRLASGPTNTSSHWFNK